MIDIDKLLLYGRTIKNLKPSQIKGRMRRMRKKRKRKPKPKSYVLTAKPRKINVFIPELDQDEGYMERFHTEALLDGEVELLHERHGLSDEWSEPTASHLWNFNLHYLEFTVPLAVKWRRTGERRYKDRWIEIVSSWLVSGSQSADALEPYTISMRLVNLLIGLEVIGEIDEGLERRVYGSLYGQYKYLSENMETDLLANHYFENLKALVIGGVAFGEARAYRRSWALFLRQVGEQTLPDGMHFERSPMYHKIALEGALRVYSVLEGAGKGTDARKLLSAVKAMAEAAVSLEKGFAATPLWNDSGDNVSKSAEALTKACGRICGLSHIGRGLRADFPDSGYYRFDNGGISVLFDCGEIGPGYMGGHGHNDCLSFELSVGGGKVFTNSGTGQYQGDLRVFFRSTSAHNTVMVDEREQNELWGEHRVARRAGGFKAFRGNGSLTGQFKSYQGDAFRRRLSWAGKRLVITDEAKSDREHVARQFLHLVPGLTYERDEGVVRVAGGDGALAAVRIPQGSDCLIHTEGDMAVFAADFGKYERKQALEVRTPFKDRVRISLEIEIYV